MLLGSDERLRLHILHYGKVPVQVVNTRTVNTSTKSCTKTKLRVK